MGEIVIALGLGAAFGLLAASADPVAGAGAFVTVFTAVSTALEKRRERLDRRREAALSAEVGGFHGGAAGRVEPPPAATGPAPVTPPPLPPRQPRPEPTQASHAAREAELEGLRDRLSLPFVDWRRTLTTAGVLSAIYIVPIILAYNAASGEDADWGDLFGLIFFLVLLIVASVPVLVGVGFWLARTARSSGGGFMDAVLMGAIVSGTTILILSIVSGTDDIGTAAGLAASGTVLASFGGWLGSLSRRWGRGRARA